MKSMNKRLVKDDELFYNWYVVVFITNLQCYDIWTEISAGHNTWTWQTWTHLANLQKSCPKKIHFDANEYPCAFLRSTLASININTSVSVKIKNNDLNISRDYHSTRAKRCTTFLNFSICKMLSLLL